MSIEATHFSCECCTFTSIDARTWGAREYVLPKGIRLDLDWRKGWCHECKNIVAVETLDLATVKQKLSKAVNYLSSLGSKPVRSWFKIRDHIGRSFQNRTEDWEFHANKLEDARDLLALLTTRKSPPKCLSCGSQHVEAPLITWSDPEIRERPVPSGFIHPECGGRLMMFCDGLRLGLKPKITRYSPEGVELEDEYVSGYTSPKRDYFAQRDAQNAQIRGFMQAKQHTYDK